MIMMTVCDWRNIHQPIRQIIYNIHEYYKCRISTTVVPITCLMLTTITTLV